MVTMEERIIFLKLEIHASPSVSFKPRGGFTDVCYLSLGLQKKSFQGRQLIKMSGSFGKHADFSRQKLNIAAKLHMRGIIFTLMCTLENSKEINRTMRS